MSNPSEILRELVEALDATNWSSWQTTAKFMPALEAARIEIAKADRALEGRPSLEMAPKDLDHQSGAQAGAVQRPVGEATPRRDDDWLSYPAEG